MKIPPASLAVRAAPITSTNKSTAITIVTCVLTAIFVIMFLLREIFKFVALRKFSLDDVFILLATICAMGLSATFLILASNGLGILEVLTLRRANALMKGYYASDFLYITSLCFAKLSLVALIYGVVNKRVQRAQRRVVKGLAIFIIAWSFASVGAVAFQCRLPRPWEMMTLNCFNIGIFWIVFCIIDMTTEVSIIMLSVNLVAYSRMRLSRKVALIACFAPRILVVAASLARLIFLYPITPHDNPEFHLWVPVVCAQIQVCLSISTACIPSMKPFFEGNEERARKRSGSKVVRRHRQGKGYYSVDSTAGTSLQYGRRSEVSPRLPSPPPLSPLIPPRLETPNSSASNSRSPSEWGLRLDIPQSEMDIRRQADMTSPQTASPNALSPNVASPYPLLSQNTLSPDKREPSPPPPSHATPSQIAQSDPIRDVVSTPRSGRFSLFPQQRPVHYSLIPQQYPVPPSPLLPLRQRSQSDTRNDRNLKPAANTSKPRDLSPITELATRRPSKPHYAAWPHSASLSSPSNLPQSPPSTHVASHSIAAFPTLTSPPMDPPMSPPTPQRIRNERIVYPRNSSRRDQIERSPTGPPSPHTFWREESAGEAATPTKSPLSAWRGRAWENEVAPPVIRDVKRDSPRLVRGEWDS